MFPKGCKALNNGMKMSSPGYYAREVSEVKKDNMNDFSWLELLIKFCLPFLSVMLSIDVNSINR
jgi:hypothetical protein